MIRKNLKDIIYITIILTMFIYSISYGIVYDNKKQIQWCSELVQEWRKQ